MDHCLEAWSECQLTLQKCALNDLGHARNRIMSDVDFDAMTAKALSKEVRAVRVALYFLSPSDNVYVALTFPLCHEV